MTEGSTPSDAVRAAAAALEQLPAVIWVFSGPDHVAVLANKAAREYRGGSRAFLLGHPLRESVPPESHELLALLDEVYRTGAVRSCYEAAAPLDGEERYVTFTAAPLRDAAGQVTGVLTYLNDVTDSVLTKRQAERRHVTLHLLQQRLLPDGLPVLPRLRVTACYRSASDELDAGGDWGDWYDAVPLGDGRLGASVGDVVGHGPPAATLMDQLRSVLTAALLADGDAPGALAQLNRFVGLVPGARGSTACAVTVDPVAGRLCYACAGHPPPVVLRSDGAAELLHARAGAPLGLPGAAPGVEDAPLGPGEAVLLYSDGAVERPGMPTERGEQRLLAACEEAWRGGSARPVELCDAVLTALTGDSCSDDVALLVLARRDVAVPRLRVEVPAVPEQLAPLRARLRHWLTEAGVAEEDALGLQIACGEATANAVEHAYRGSEPGIVALSAELTDDSAVRLRVTDSGRWREPPTDPGGRGRGLLLMRQCTDTVELRRAPAGTEVELVRRVRGSPVEQPLLEVGDEPGLGVRVESTGGGALATLVGDLDTGTARDAGRVLREASRGGSLPLVVDVAELAHLASAGVRLLFELAAEAISAGRRLAVRALRGSGPHHVLELTGYGQVAELLVADPPRRPAADRPAGVEVAG